MYIPHLLLLLRSSLFYHARVLPFAARARVPPKIFQTDAAAAPLSLSLSLLPFFPSSNSTEFHPVQHLREQRANARVCVYSRFPASLLRGVVICPGVLLKSQSDDFSRGSFRDGSAFFFVRVCVSDFLVFSGLGSRFVSMAFLVRTYDDSSNSRDTLRE